MRYRLSKGVIRGLLGCLSVGWLAGCTTPAPAECGFWIEPGVRASLPRTVCESEGTVKAVLTARREGRTERVLTLRTCRADRLTIDVLTLTGMALMTVTYDGTTLTRTAHVPIPTGLDASQIVADVLLSSLPAPRWTSFLPQGYHWETVGTERRLLNAERRVTERFQYDAEGRLQRLAHEAFGYTIDFRYLKETNR